MNHAERSGVLGFFETPEALVAAMEKVRAANYQNFDAFTPFPVHGLEHAQGLKRSWIPWVTFLMGMTGASVGFGFQYWTSAVDWPIIIGGKPFNSWPAFVPVMFELTILFAGISTFVAMLGTCGLPNVLKRSFDPSLTSNRFAIHIEPPTIYNMMDEVESRKYKPFDENEAKDFLKKVGATEVRTVKNEGWF